MKKLFTVLSLFLVGISVSAQAPSLELDAANMRDGEDIEYCLQHKKMIDLLKNPARMKIHQADQAKMKAIEDSLNAASSSRSSGQRGTVYTIPVVFHVLHNNGPENISMDQILSAVDVLNIDYRLLNSDANNVAASFQGMPADAEIEFALATKAPNGACFSGVTRTVTPLTSDGSSGSAQVSAVINGNDVYNGQWAPSKYLNIYVCEDIGGAAGYTFNPGSWTGNSMYYNGIFVQHTYTGDMGTSSLYTSRTLTHEVGHWLNLSHTWGSNNNPGNASSCSSDDGVGDTPNTIGVTSCNLNENSCGPIANVENYMDYSYCSKMFTGGQITRMRAALTSGVAGRNNLYTSANLTATGANTAPVLCKAEFTSNKTLICEGDQVAFTDASFNNVTGVTWTFNGGTPSTSSSSTPTVTYNTAGTYAVTLSATDGTNTVSETKTSYITVMPSPGRNLPYEEGFEVLEFPSPEWTITGGDNVDFEITTAAAATGTHSLRLRNSTASGNDVDEFISANVDLSDMTDLTVSFKYAFAKKSSNNTDVLKILASSNCGESWSVRKNISSSSIATAGNAGSSWAPSGPDDWEQVVITNISGPFFSEDFRLKFSFEAGGGNNLYIDDIDIYGVDNQGNQVGSEGFEGIAGITDNVNVNDLFVYPNPTRDIANLNFFLNHENTETSIYVTDMLGKKVLDIHNGNLMSGEQKFVVNTSSLSRGVYYFNVMVNGSISTSKLIIE